MAYVEASTSVETAPKDHTAAARYLYLSSEREPYLKRARECAALTIPGLMPPEGSTGATTLDQPYQGTGADCVNNLASKMTTTLFPPGASFFRQSVDDFVVEDIAKTTGNEAQDVRGELDEAFGKIDRAVIEKMEGTGFRVQAYEADLNDIVAGNGLIHIDDDGSWKFFRLDRFVVSRDLAGNPLEIIVEECIDKDALPKELREVFDRQSQAENGGVKSDRKDVKVYTWVRQEENGKSWKVHQEVCGEIVTGSEGSYPVDACAWIPRGWSHVSGEPYYRAKVEEHLPDFQSLDSLTKSVVEGAAAAAKILVLVNEGGVTNKETVASADNGAVIDGDAKDITFLHTDKAQDFGFAERQADKIQARLERAFLLASSIQRQAERVTAEEIRLMAAELEQSVGGAYTSKSEFQRRVVMRYLHLLSKDKKAAPALRKALSAIPKGVVRPKIVTGLDALGRNQEMQRLDALLAGTLKAFGPDAVKEVVKPSEYVKRLGASLGVPNMEGLVKTEQEIAQEQEQAQRKAQMQSLAEKATGPAINAYSQNIQAAQQQQAAPTTPPNG